MDINEDGYGPWGRWMYINGAGSWSVDFYNNVHASTPNPPVSFDIVCFRNEITTLQHFNSAAEASDIAPDDVRPDFNSYSEEAGQ